jgi:predicted nicotinamide N-methyase
MHSHYLRKMPGEESSDTDKQGSQQFLTETPLEALGPIIRERVIVAGQTFLIDHPDDSEDVTDHPAVKAAFAADEYLPFWTELWPAARMLARTVLEEKWPNGTSALELGCGLGLPGIAALARGLQVTFSDCDATALRFAADNAHLNGFDDFATLQFDWRCPPPGLRFPVLLASDLIYELRHINPLVALIQSVLIPGGICLLTDEDRLPAYNLRDALLGEGMPFTTRTLHAGAPGKLRVRGTLYRITVQA